MEKILELKGVTKSFGSKTVVNNLSFDILPGEICGFLGPNGSGKTTTIKMISGLLFADIGEINICGYSVRYDFEKALANVGAIVENPDSYLEFTGRMNIALAARINNVPVSRQNEVIEQVALTKRIDEKVKKYSLGMKQRLGIAIALLNAPKLLIFDEPTNGLDPNGIKDFRETVKKLAHENGAGVLVSSHMMSEMEILCDKVVMIEKGKLIDIKKINEIKNTAEKGKKSTYFMVVSNGIKAQSVISEQFSVKSVVNELKESGLFEIFVDVKAETVPQIVKTLVLNGIEIWSVHTKEQTLEDAYMSAMEGGNI